MSINLQRGRQEFQECSIAVVRPEQQHKCCLGGQVSKMSVNCLRLAGWPQDCLGVTLAMKVCAWPLGCVGTGVPPVTPAGSILGSARASMYSRGIFYL